MSLGIKSLRTAKVQQYPHTLPASHYSVLIHTQHLESYDLASEKQCNALCYLYKHVKESGAQTIAPSSQLKALTTV